MLRTTREVTAQSRLRLLNAASRLLRQRGFEASIADVMSAVGMTHGGFYKHVPSKEALADEAVLQIATRFDAYR